MYMSKLGLISHFSRPLPASIWGHLLVSPSFYEHLGHTKRGVTMTLLVLFLPSIWGMLGPPKYTKTRENAAWQLDPVAPPPPTCIEIRRVSETPTPTGLGESAGVHIHCVRQYTLIYLYRGTFPASKPWREGSPTAHLSFVLQDASHLYGRTPPLCTAVLLRKYFRERKTHKHKQICGIVPGLGGCQNFVYVFFFGGSFLMGEKNTWTKSPPKSRDNPVKNLWRVLFFMCFFFFRFQVLEIGVGTSQRGIVQHTFCQHCGQSLDPLDAKNTIGNSWITRHHFILMELIFAIVHLGLHQKIRPIYFS